MKTPTLFLGLCCLIIGLSACNSKQQEIEGTRWIVQTIGQQTIAVDSTWAEQPSFQLEPSEKRINGFAGCNRFFGNYALTEPNRIQFDHMGATKMFCPNIQVEDLLLQTLAQAYTVKVEKDQLFLYDEYEKELMSCTPSEVSEE